MNLPGWLRGALGLRSSFDHTYPAWQEAQAYGQGMYGTGLQQTINGNAVEKIGPDYVGLASGAYRSSGVIFACMLLRSSVFSTVRFQYQQLVDGRPSKLFGDPSLDLLEEPWTGGTTQDLLDQVINDADLAGNSFHMVETSMATLGGDGGQEMVRLRPDWVSVILQPRESGLGYRKIGYTYCEGGYGSGNAEVPLLAEDVAHFAPRIDPLARYRGMSWLTPIVREIEADRQMTAHKDAFMRNGATPNMIIKHPVGMTPEKVRQFRDVLDAGHAGSENAGKTLHLGGGSDGTVVGSNFREIEFAVTQAGGENRIAAAAGTPSLLVGLAGGMESAQYANYSPARRRFAEGTMYPLWQNVAGCFAGLMPKQAPGVRLWFDSRDVPFLREDEKDAAEIAEMEARTMRALVDGGYSPDSVKAAVLAGDFGLLEHTGWFSVQLQQPGAQEPKPEAIPAPTPLKALEAGK